MNQKQRRKRLKRLNQIRKRQRASAWTAREVLKHHGLDNLEGTDCPGLHQSILNKWLLLARKCWNRHR